MQVYEYYNLMEFTLDIEFSVVKYLKLTNVHTSQEKSSKFVLVVEAREVA